MWRHVQGYAKSAYVEKSVLLDPEVSAAIASAIAARSERDTEGAVFMDAEAGCLDVTRVLLERGAFARAQVLVKDAKLRPLHEWALRETLYHVADRY